MSSKAANGGFMVWIQTRKTIPGLDKPQKKALLLHDSSLTIQSLKALIKKSFPTLLDPVPLDNITVYYYNHRADDYIVIKPSAKVSTNPLPDLFAESPGRAEDQPLYFDFLQPSSSTSSNGGEKIWVQPRKTMKLPPTPTPVTVPNTNILAASFKGMLRTHFPQTQLDHIPSESINLYYYNKLADDYIPITDAHAMGENPLPQMFADPPGKTQDHPIFFDYIEEVAAGPGSTTIWVQPRKTIGLPTSAVSLVVSNVIIVSSLKGAIRTRFAPALDTVALQDINVYYFNHSADDYIPLADATPVAHNPLPELFTDAPGKTPARPLFFDFIRRDSNVWVQPRKTIPVAPEKKEIHVPSSACSLDELKASLQKAYAPALDSVPTQTLNVYFYNHSADDYIPLPSAFRLGQNPLPELFTDPPGTVFSRPLFFDYLQR